MLYIQEIAKGEKKGLCYTTQFLEDRQHQEYFVPAISTKANLPLKEFNVYHKGGYFPKKMVCVSLAKLRKEGKYTINSFCDICDRRVYDSDEVFNTQDICCCINCVLHKAEKQGVQLFTDNCNSEKYISYPEYFQANNDITIAFTPWPSARQLLFYYTTGFYIYTLVIANFMCIHSVKSRIRRLLPINYRKVYRRR